MCHQYLFNGRITQDECGLFIPAHQSWGHCRSTSILSSATCDLDLPKLPLDFPTQGHVINSFYENVIDVGWVCNTKYSILFTEHKFTIVSLTGTPVLVGWRKNAGHKLYCILLIPKPKDVAQLPNTLGVIEISLAVFSVYGLPSGKALIQYFHAILVENV